MGLHEIVIGAVALLVLYIAYVLIRVAVLSRGKKKTAQAETAAPPKPVVEAEPETPEAMLSQKTKSAPQPADSVTPEALERQPFDALIEVARLRFQIESLEASQLAMRDELDALRDEVEAQRNARSVAPHYSEAVVLAQRGLDSAAIAERCGISVSEAELVAALARGAGRGES